MGNLHLELIVGLLDLRLDELENLIEETDPEIWKMERGRGKGRYDMPEEEVHILVDNLEPLFEKRSDLHPPCWPDFDKVHKDLAYFFRVWQILGTLLDDVLHLKLIPFPGEQVLVSEHSLSVIEDFENGAAQGKHVHHLKLLNLHVVLDLGQIEGLVHYRAVCTFGRHDHRVPHLVLPCLFLRCVWSVDTQNLARSSLRLGQVLTPCHFLWSQCALVDRRAEEQSKLSQSIFRLLENVKGLVDSKVSQN